MCQYMIKVVMVYVNNSYMMYMDCRDMYMEYLLGVDDGVGKVVKLNMDECVDNKLLL